MKNCKRFLWCIFLNVSLLQLAGAAVIFIDNGLTVDYTDNYSIANRNSEGSDGDAYNTIQEGINSAEAGDTVSIRGGIYYPSSYIKILNKTGTDTNNPIIIRAYAATEADAPETVTIDGNYTAPTTSFGLLYIQNSDYVQLKYLIVQNYHMGIYYNNSDYPEVFRCMVRNNNSTGVTIYISNYATVSYNTMCDCNGNGINIIGSSYCTVDKNEIYNNSIGIRTGWHDLGNYEISAHNTISSNLVYDNNKRPEDSDGINISSGSRYNTVINNISYRNADDGLDASTGQALVGPVVNGYESSTNLYASLLGNICFENGDGEGDGDGNGVKFGVNYSGGHLIAYNVSFDNEENGILSAGSSGYPRNYVYNNTSYHNGYAMVSVANNKGILVDSSKDDQDERAVLYNNLVYDNYGKDFAVTASKSIYDSNNNFISDSNFVDGYDGDSLSGDPKLLNSDLPINTTFSSNWTIDQKIEYIRSQVKEKFTLKDMSPAIDAGRVIDGYHCPRADDDPEHPMDPDTPGRHWLGAAPDIGAFEYGLDPYNIDSYPEPEPGSDPKPDPDPEIEPEETLVPDETKLACYNNVINPSKGDKATICVELDKQAHVMIVIYDNNGKEIKKLINEEKQPGFYTFKWNGRDDSDNTVGSGIYIVNMKSGNYKSTNKIAVVK